MGCQAGKPGFWYRGSGKCNQTKICNEIIKNIENVTKQKFMILLQNIANDSADWIIR